MTRRRLVLHVGLPKTGSSALQKCCDDNRQQFLQHSVNYPLPEEHLISRKHQFLINSLLRGRFDQLCSILEQNNARTIILSTEGLTNHLYDFPPEHLATFRDITSAYEVTIFVVFRERESWTRSRYKQSVLSSLNARGEQATSLKYEEFCALRHTMQLTDPTALCKDLKSAYGAQEVVAVAYERDWMAAFVAMLGIPSSTMLKTLERVHVSVSDELVEIVRQVNALGVTQQERTDLLAALQACLATQHQALQHFYPKAASKHLPIQKHREIVAKIIPGNQAQEDLLHVFSAWLSEPARAKLDYSKILSVPELNSTAKPSSD